MLEIALQQKSLLNMLRRIPDRSKHVGLSIVNHFTIKNPTIADSKRYLREFYNPKLSEEQIE